MQKCPDCKRPMKLYNATDGRERWYEFYCAPCDFRLPASYITSGLIIPKGQAQSLYDFYRDEEASRVEGGA